MMRIEVRKEKCTGCRLCQQICAITHFNEINPKKSAIGISAELQAPGRFVPTVCDQCGECSSVCFVEALELKDGIYVLDPDECTFCAECIETCPLNAITMHADEEAPIKCDLCLKCTEICNSGALTAVE